jgi:hypothetical protein
MIRWRRSTGHDARILAEQGHFICTASSPKVADQMVQEHNALLECVEALDDVHETLFCLADLAGDVAEWNERGFAYETARKVRAALEKLNGECNAAT